MPVDASVNYFSCVLHEKQYVYIEKADKYVENLHLILNDREKESIVFMSSESFSIVSALNCGFNTVPVVHFEGLNNDDY